ncbi:hypothetical protein F2P45_15840 [Massilia sp. CCM 8733]|uniref:Uncharacterized protein n=1 Tax=Massilia mucilaginosa TaxID=2609282 RepID=A0ABX0NUQ6_9BURK|nr:hypothetical protein [Massilia mucilaginosa]NHZ90479.1 hypothetical protein [Massilia mucilaginosa]
MDAINMGWLLILTNLACVIVLLSKASTHSERLKKIEMLILSQPDIDTSVLDLSAEAKKMIMDGHKYRAMALHREQTDSTARSAELAVEKFIAQQI